MIRHYLTTDVFTDQLFGGNQLAVVLDAEGLSTAQMQSIAQEFNYSETTFVLPPRNPRHSAQVRIFTPRAEMPFAGHPNVGTAFLLAREHDRELRVGESALDQLVFEELAGLVPMSLWRDKGEVVGAELRAPEPLSCRSTITADQAAACLSLSVQDIALSVHAPRVLSVGLPFLVVEIASRAALARARPNLTAFDRVFPLDHSDAVFAYWPGGTEGETRLLQARMFCPGDGVVEDPATGSATAATVAFLASLQPGPEERRWRISQGVEMGRPSALAARTVGGDGAVSAVYVGGRCVPVMRGTFELAGELVDARSGAKPLASA